MLTAFLTGIMLLLSGLSKFRRIVEKVPHSIVVGFTISIAVVIAFSQIVEVLGIWEKVGYGIIDQLTFLSAAADASGLKR